MLKSFEKWFGEVDVAVNALVGVSVHDLPDAPFVEWWEDGRSPKSAAKAAVAEAW